MRSIKIAWKSLWERKLATLFIMLQLVISFYLISNGFIQLSIPDYASETIKKYSNLDLEKTLTFSVPDLTSDNTWSIERYLKLRKEVSGMNEVSNYGSFSTAYFILSDLKNSDLYEEKNQALYKNSPLRGKEKLSYMVYFDESIFSSSKIKILKGRSLAKQDFAAEHHEQIPVLVGQDYEGIFDIGDTFSIYWFGEKLNYRVVGVMDRESKWLDKNDYISMGVRDLNAAIVTPFLDYQKNSSPFVISSLQKSTFVSVQDTDDRKILSEKIKQAATQLGLPSPIVRSIKEELDAYKKSKIELVKLNLYAGVFFLLTTSIGIITSTLSSIRIRFYEFGIRRVFGESIISIARSIIIEVFLLILLSACFGVFWNYYNSATSIIADMSSVKDLFGIALFAKVIILVLLLTFLSVLYPIRVLYRESPYKLISGVEN
ncbi:ABC transporter permease [Paenibacillus elgii]|uniref:ABC transporter permease n=1 Tax=Paenibacillus elgii TaxID=189691 RepID=UPI00203BBEA8|nr:ABC transporter permease [Paenibacillus elgii]MCM3268942.1 ABC transporter permease [Paenibacillus elgii]